ATPERRVRTLRVPSTHPPHVMPCTASVTVRRADADCAGAGCATVPAVVSTGAWASACGRAGRRVCAGAASETETRPPAVPMEDRACGPQRSQRARTLTTAARPKVTRGWIIGAPGVRDMRVR